MPDTMIRSGEALVFDENRRVRVLRSVADDNARCILWDLTPGDTQDVPVVMFGTGLAGRDLAHFNGITQPMLATLDQDGDSYVALHHSADDTPVIRLRTSSGTVREHVIPDVASSTLAVLGTAQTWTAKQTIAVAGVAIEVQNTTDEASNQVAVFRGGNRVTPADADEAYISLKLDDDAGDPQEYVRLTWIAKDVTAATKDGQFKISVVTANTLTDMLIIDSTSAGVVTATVAAGDVILNDGVSLKLGTAGAEADLSSDGTNVTWTFAGTAVLAIAGNTTDATALGTAAITTVGGLSVAKSIYAGGNVNLTVAGANATASEYAGYKARGTVASPTVITTGDDLLRIAGYGYDGDSFVKAAEILLDSEGTIADTRVGGRIVFRTATDAAPSVLTDRLILDSAGVLSPSANDGVALGTTALGFADLHLATGAVINWVNGDVTLTHAANALTWAGATTYTFDTSIIQTAGIMYLGDTANAKMTLGLTINQGAADDGILALKSSDVATGITIDSETDTFGWAAKVVAASGGLKWSGAGSANYGIAFGGFSGTVDTTKTATSVAGTLIQTAKVGGGSVVSVGANGNLVAILDYDTTRFLFDAEGSLHLTEVVAGLGEGSTTALTGGTISAPDIITGGAGNVAGADLTLAAGLGTGTGDVGTIIFSLPVVAAAGDNLQTSVTALTIDMVASTTAPTFAFPTGTILDFGAGDVTIIHSANTLAIAGGSSYTLDGAAILKNNAVNFGPGAVTSITVVGGQITAIS